VDAEFLFFLPGFESGRAALDRQSRDSFFAFRRIGVYIDDRRVSHAAIGDPRLGAVDNVAVAFAHCLGCERRCVRARLRLGQRVAANFFTARERREKFLFLLLGAETMNRIAIQRILHRENHAGGSADAGNFFNDDGVRDVVEARTAFGFRQCDGGQAQFGGLAECFAGEMTGLVDLARQRLDFVFGEFPHGALQQLLFFIQLEVQRITPRNDAGREIINRAPGEVCRTSREALPARDAFRRS